MSDIHFNNLGYYQNMLNSSPRQAGYFSNGFMSDPIFNNSATGMYPFSPSVASVFSNPVNSQELVFNMQQEQNAFKAAFNDSYMTQNYYHPQNVYEPQSNFGGLTGFSGGNDLFNLMQVQQNNIDVMKAQLDMLKNLEASFDSSETTSDDFDYDSEKGAELASIARDVAGEMPGSGLCATGVKKALVRSGLMPKYVQGDAYQVSNMLENNDNFKEVELAESNLDELPAGAVVVWDRSSQKKYGHVSIALGNGQEASDTIGEQKVDGSKYGGHRVFVPVSA